MYLFCVCFFCFVLLCFVSENKQVSIYALISRDEFQQTIAKALATNGATACVRCSHKNGYHLYSREVNLGHQMQVKRIFKNHKLQGCPMRWGASDRVNGRVRG